MLQDAPRAFWSTFADEAAFTDERVARADRGPAARVAGLRRGAGPSGSVAQFRTPRASPTTRRNLVACGSPPTPAGGAWARRSSRRCSTRPRRPTGLRRVMLDVADENAAAGRSTSGAGSPAPAGPASCRTQPRRARVRDGRYLLSDLASRLWVNTRTIHLTAVPVRRARVDRMSDITVRRPGRGRVGAVPIGAAQRAARSRPRRSWPPPTRNAPTTRTSGATACGAPQRLLAERDGAPSAWPASVRPPGGREGQHKVAELFGLWVRPAARGTGVATQLVQAGADAARQQRHAATWPTGSAPTTVAPSPSRAASASAPPTAADRCASAARTTARRRSPWSCRSARTAEPPAPLDRARGVRRGGRAGRSGH